MGRRPLFTLFGSWIRNGIRVSYGAFSGVVNLQIIGLYMFSTMYPLGMPLRVRANGMRIAVALNRLVSFVSEIAFFALDYNSFCWGDSCMFMSICPTLCGIYLCLLARKQRCPIGAYGEDV